jgi:hypothetical protein
MLAAAVAGGFTACAGQPPAAEATEEDLAVFEGLRVRCRGPLSFSSVSRLFTGGGKLLPHG